MGNYNDALTDIKGMIELKYKSFPLHQGICDVTEVIEFARIATGHNLTDKQYDKLIDAGESYYKSLIR